MRAVEWNKKEELVADQALRHLKVDQSILYNRPYSYPSIRLELTWSGCYVLLRQSELCQKNVWERDGSSVQSCCKKQFERKHCTRHQN